MTAKETLPERLLYLREDRELSRQKAANDLGITRASLEFYEKGRRTPDINMIVKIAKYYNVSVDYLFGVSDYYNETSEDILTTTGLSPQAVDFLSKEPENLEITDAILSVDQSNLKILYWHIYLYLNSEYAATLVKDDKSKLEEIETKLKEKIGYGLGHNLEMLQPAITIFALEDALVAFEEVLRLVRKSYRSSDQPKPTHEDSTDNG